MSIRESLELLQQLVEVTSSANTGAYPTPLGTLPPRTQDRMFQIQGSLSKLRQFTKSRLHGPAPKERKKKNSRSNALEG